MANLQLQFVNSYYDSRMKLRHTFRRKGFKRETIPGKPGDAEFMARYQELLKKTGGDAEMVDRDAPGSVDSIIKAYLKDDVFKKNLAKATQDMREAILKRFREFKTPSGARYGDALIAELPRKPERIADAIKGLSPNAQKNYLKALRHFMVYAMTNDDANLKSDPTAGIKAAKPQKTQGHMTWHSEQIEQYRNHHALGSVQRLALELALNIAARRHDCHLIGRQHLKEGKLTWKPHKTQRTTGKSLTVRVMPELQAAIDAMPRSDAMAFITTQGGRAIGSPAAFGNAFADWCRAAGLKPVTCDDGKVRSYRIHGLRKAALTALAHDGCTGPELMAVSGHATLAQVQVYIDEAEQERLAEAAMTKRFAAR